MPNKVIDAALDVPGLMEKRTGETIGNPAHIAAITEAAYLLHKVEQATDGRTSEPMMLGEGIPPNRYRSTSQRWRH